MGGWCFLIFLFFGLVALLEKPMMDLKYDIWQKRETRKRKEAIQFFMEQNKNRPKPIIPKKEFVGKELEESEIREKFREYYNLTYKGKDGYDRENWVRYSVALNDSKNDIWDKFIDDTNNKEYKDKYLMKLPYAKYIIPNKEIVTISKTVLKNGFQYYPPEKELKL